MIEIEVLPKQHTNSVRRLLLLIVQCLPIVFAADHNSNFDAKEDTYDGSHPNPVGEMKMAQKWFDSLQPLMSPTLRQSARLLD